jgi:hypothetical protein
VRGTLAIDIAGILELAGEGGNVLSSSLVFPDVEHIDSFRSNFLVLRRRDEVINRS